MVRVEKEIFKYATKNLRIQKHPGAHRYGGPQQNQMLTANYKFKSLTANSNRSHQIQIAHSELQITHSKLQIAHSKFKSPTANSNRSQQIKVAHSKFKSLTAN